MPKLETWSNLKGTSGAVPFSRKPQGWKNPDSHVSQNPNTFPRRAKVQGLDLPFLYTLVF